MINNLPIGLAEIIAIRARPCILRCDAVGQVHERFCHPESAIPVDIRNASSLDQCLSRPVLHEWIQLIRETICTGCPIDALVVVDGVGFNLLCVTDSNSKETPGVWLTLIQMSDTLSVVPRQSRRALRHHEWGRLDSLSRSQLDTLRWITRGMSNQQIAEHVHRSKRAVEWHIRHLHRLLLISTREALARLGRVAALDCFDDREWAEVLDTRPARRSLEEYALADRPRQVS